MTWTHGQYPGAPSPGQPQPQATRTPRLSAKPAAAVSIVVFPMPASPASSSRWPRPATASSTTRRSSARTSSRPTGPALRATFSP